MTVQQLIDRLGEFPADLEVKALWDSTPDFPVHRVELFRGVVLIDCGDEEDGDWQHLVEDHPEINHG